MKKLLFKVSVPDKNGVDHYEAGKVYPFEDARADEILAKRTRVTGEPFAVEYVEEDANTNENAPKDEVTGTNAPSNEGENLNTGNEVKIDDLKVDELKQIAETLGIEGYKSMKKDELLQAISEKEAAIEAMKKAEEQTEAATEPETTNTAENTTDTAENTTESNTDNAVIE